MIREWHNDGDKETTGIFNCFIMRPARAPRNIIILSRNFLGMYIYVEKLRWFVFD